MLVISPPGGRDVFSFLSEIAGVKDNVAIAIYRGSRKWIVPLFSRGNVFGYAKIYDREAREYGETEADTLEALSKSDLSGFAVPKVLSRADFGGRFVLLLSSRDPLKRSCGILPAHYEWLRTLSRETGQKAEFQNAPFSKSFSSEIDFLKSKIPERFPAIESAVREAEAALRGKAFVFSLTMREFPYFQILRSPGGPFVIDWEESRFGYPPAFDLFSLLLSAGKRSGGSYVALYENNVENIFFRKNGKTANAFRALLPAWGMSAEDAYYFFILFLVDQLYIHLHVGHTESAERIISLFEKRARGEGPISPEKWLGGGGF